MALVMPGLVSLSQAQAPQTSVATRPAFDSVSIKVNKSGDGPGVLGTKPGGRFVGTNAPLGMLIDLAYHLGPQQRIGGPDWIDSERFDIEAKIGSNSSGADLRSMEQAMLADRFGLIVHHETRPIAVYALVVSKVGALAPADSAKCAVRPAGAPPPGGLPNCGSMFSSPATSNIAVHYTGRSVPMGYLLRMLGGFLDRMVVNKTDLSGRYDFDLEFMPPRTLAAQTAPDAPVRTSPAPQSIFTALQEQLGLNLEPQTAPADVLVIDHAGQPSEN